MTSTCRRSGVTGRSTPAHAPTWADQAPAATTTPSQAIVPLLVWTAVTRSPLRSIPVTSTPRTIRAPWRRAFVAYPATTDAGSQCPSPAWKAAASRPSVTISGESRCASSTSIIRVGTPSEFWIATASSKARTSSGVDNRKW